jgi:hypothetical protein
LTSSKGMKEIEFQQGLEDGYEEEGFDVGDW